MPPALPDRRRSAAHRTDPPISSLLAPARADFSSGILRELATVRPGSSPNRRAWRDAAAETYRVLLRRSVPSNAGGPATAPSPRRCCPAEAPRHSRDPAATPRAIGLLRREVLA